MLKEIVTVHKPSIIQSLFVEAHIADIHFGSIDPLIEYNILKEQFLAYLYDMNILDIVAIDGDLFDHKFMASSEVVMYANQFIYDLINICKMKNATLILISGTASHDSDQLRLYYPLTTLKDVDVRVVLETKFIYVKGKKILCIPELYNKGSEYYNKFLKFSGFYDCCYMHGTYKGSIYGKNKSDLDSNREPVFDIHDFDNCKGPIISGHVHIPNTLDNDFYYTGSPIRYKFGEEQEKGFIILIHDISTRHYEIHREPIKSFRYDTIELSDIIKSDPNTIINYIEQIKKSGIDYLRVIFTINDMDKINLLKSYYRNNKNIKIVTNFEQEIVQEKLNELEEEYKKEYSYLFDNNLSTEEKLVQYMNLKKGSTYWTIESLKALIENINSL